MEKENFSTLEVLIFTQLNKRVSFDVKTTTSTRSYTFENGYVYTSGNFLIIAQKDEDNEINTQVFELENIKAYLITP